MRCTTRKLAGLTLFAVLTAELTRPANVREPNGPLESGAARLQKGAQVPFEPFDGSVDEARRSAAERNVPLLIHMILEGEAQNDEYRDQILPDRELQQLCERAVVIISNNGEHPQTTVKEVVDDNEFERPACSVYRHFESCNGHRQTWDPLYFEFHEENGDLLCPQTILLDPEGKISWRFNTANPPPVGDVVSALERAQRAAGAGLTLVELARVKTAVARGRKLALEGDHAGAWRSWTEITEVVTGGTYGDEAAAGAQAALAAMKAALETARKQLVPGQAAAGYALLLELDAACVGTPLEREVQDTLKKAERNKAIKEEIAAYKLELEAQRLWDEALALIAEEQARKAEKTVKRVLRKKYRGTKAAAAARERFPELAAEIEASGK